MPNTRQILLISDFSCKDICCILDGGGNPKLSAKRTYHIVHQSGSFDNSNVSPQDTSIPATNGIDESTYNPGAGYDNVLIADKGIIKEIWEDCTIEWRANYIDCDTVEWELVNVDLDLADERPDLVPLDCTLLQP